ncbi:MAG TPA: hypothetical protein VFT65_02725 [Candidatus Angelobacter sp.]|nr:hypothetical protein [Candidatus Angelobacter sp.]
MARKQSAVLSLICATCIFAQSPRGTVPRPDASRYPAHAENHGLQIGAVELTKKEVKKAFFTDVNQCCVVVEVALYPAKDKAMKIALQDFTLREPGKTDGAQLSDAGVLAGRLELRPLPPDSEHRPGVEIEEGVGARRGPGENGDPRQHKTVTEDHRVSVGIPVGGDPQSPAAEGTFRKAIEDELQEKMLPAATDGAPVSGYLYFAVPRKNKGDYELVYTINEEKIVLHLK